MKLEVVQSTSYSPVYPASSVLLLGEQDEVIFGSNFYNFWLAEQAGWSKTGQGFTLRVDTCIRLIEGCQVKNLGDDDDDDDDDDDAMGEHLHKVDKPARLTIRVILFLFLIVRRVPRPSESGCKKCNGLKKYLLGHTFS